MAFEGNETEERYFSEFKESNKFNDDIICLHLLKRAKNDTRSAPNHVFKKLKEEARDEYNFNENDELWMIIDTDRWKNIPEIVDACDSIQNMFVAVSNPCFEFWLLLHIKNIDEYNNVELEQILQNKKVGRNRNYVELKILEILGSYNKSNINPNDFLPYLNMAISQSKALDIPQELYPTKLGSHIYRLIEKIQKE